MDLLERFNNKFGKWYEGLFGNGDGELRPKDVLRKIIAAMEDNRKEGFDGKIYVPNKYVLELAVSDAEERDYLLSFLDAEELTTVLQRFMAQNHYHARGPLDFTIAEVPPAEQETRREKLRVKVRFEKGELAPAKPNPVPANDPPPVSPNFGNQGVFRNQGLRASTPDPLDDLPTIPGIPEEEDEPGTVPAIAWATLAVTTPDGRKQLFSLSKPVTTIGRSRLAGNDLVLDSDGLASKSHARIERERDGRFSLYDLGSTNGIKINGTRIEDNQELKDGDEILIGATQLTFQQAGNAASPMAANVAVENPPRRARLLAPNGEAYVLASETLIGRAVTCDIVLNAPAVSTKHARIIAPDAATYYLEDLGSEYGTMINHRPIPSKQRTLLADGDVVMLGTTELRFQSETGQRSPS